MPKLPETMKLKNPFEVIDTLADCFNKNLI